MPYLERLSDLSPASLARFDAIIDVRSPDEFRDDHLPGAISLPVLSNDERAMVGTIYKQESPFKASRIGAAIVARNIAAHLETSLVEFPKTWRPLIYCWRGGMRSNAMATILSSIGWPVGVIEGGYRTWRREVTAGLDQSPAPLPIVLIDGETGAGKTALLQTLAARGAQVVDLEALACHRGSAFGDWPDQPQPAQRLFESQLWTALRSADLTQPIFVEAESARIGARRVPRRVWLAMRSAPRVALQMPVFARAAALVAAYPDAVADSARVIAALSRLKGQHADETLEAWRALAMAGDHAAFAHALIEAHYDPLYARARKRLSAEPVLRVSLADVSAAELTRAADAILTAGAALLQPIEAGRTFHADMWAPPG